MIKHANPKGQERKILKTKKRKRVSVQHSKSIKEHYYPYVLYAIITSVFVFFVTFRAINISVDRQIKVQIPEKKEPLPVDMLAKPAVTEKGEEELPLKLNSSDPEEYNIQPQRQSPLLQNQRRWNSSTRKIVRKSDVVGRMSQEGAFKGIKKTPEQFEQQLKRIEGRIREYKKKVQNDPGDDYARQKLQGLYMLKATLTGLKKAVVEK